MPGIDSDIVTYESHLARRIGWLFRVEWTGVLMRRPPELERRLRDRRGELIDALIRADTTRRSRKIPISPELQSAAEALWRESGLARRAADARLDQLRTGLAMTFGIGVSSGIRGTATGQIIARG